MSNEELGTRIRNYRHANKLSQAELALMLGVSQPTIGSWELGTCSPTGEKRDYILRLILGKKEELSEEHNSLKEIIYHQKTIIELLKDKIRGLGGSV